MRVELTLTHSGEKKTILFSSITLSWDELRHHVRKSTGQRDLKFVKELKITRDNTDDEEKSKESIHNK